MMTNDEVIAHLFTHEAANLKFVREAEESTAHTGHWATRKDQLISYLAAADASLRERVERWREDDRGRLSTARTTALVHAGYFKMVPKGD